MHAALTVQLGMYSDKCRLVVSNWQLRFEFFRKLTPALLKDVVMGNLMKLKHRMILIITMHADYDNLQDGLKSGL